MGGLPFAECRVPAFDTSPASVAPFRRRRTFAPSRLRAHSFCVVPRQALFDDAKGDEAPRTLPLPSSPLSASLSRGLALDNRFVSRTWRSCSRCCELNLSRPVVRYVLGRDSSPETLRLGLNSVSMRETSGVRLLFCRSLAYLPRTRHSP